MKEARIASLGGERNAKPDYIKHLWHYSVI